MEVREAGGEHADRKARESKTPLKGTKLSVYQPENTETRNPADG